jgi:hypothetical protein
MTHYIEEEKQLRNIYKWIDEDIWNTVKWTREHYIKNRKTYEALPADVDFKFKKPFKQEISLQCYVANGNKEKAILTLAKWKETVNDVITDMMDNQEDLSLRLFDENDTMDTAEQVSGSEQLRFYGMMMRLKFDIYDLIIRKMN